MAGNTWISRLIAGTILVHLFLFLAGQDRFPEYGTLYDNSSLARFDVNIHPDTLAWILADENVNSDREFRANVTFTRGTYSETFLSVGFRLRGNTSRYSAKKSFKISLNTFTPGLKFHGVEKINLNGEHNDPSMSRALLSWYLFREGNVPGSRSNHVRLYINGEYRGLYINVEHIDEEFTQLRFGNNDGSLYKCLWPADLTYMGSNQENYKFEHSGRRAYERKNNDGADDYSDLVNFIRILNIDNPADFPAAFNRVFNINIYLKTLAVEYLIGHWDAYSFNKNNYYLYHNEGTGKFEYIPYDPDNTFGISWFEDDWSARNIYAWTNPGEPRPLTEKILQIPVYKDRFSFYVDQFLKSVYNNSTLDPFLDSIRKQISAPAADDPYRGLDYGYTYQDFYNSFENAAGAHVRLGIKPFIAARAASARQQLQLHPIDPIITLLSVNQPDFFENATVRFLVEDDQGIENIAVKYSAGDDFQERTFTSLGDGYYEVSFPGLATDGSIEYYFEATDLDANTSREPEEGYYRINYGIAGAEGRIAGEEFSVRAYPNPASGHFFIDVPAGNTVEQYRLFDLSGKVVQSGVPEDVTGRVTTGPGVGDGLFILGVRTRTTDGKEQQHFSKIIINGQQN